MSWRNQLRPASFRGVPFYVNSVNGQVGRRTVTHEYPQREVPYAEDMGRKARSFTVEGYVLGTDYMAARDKLIAALEQSGPGTLVHHYWGAMQVVLQQPASIVEKASEGGIARFTMLFGEAGDNLNPSVKPDTATLVGNNADSAIGALSSDFSGSFTVASLPSFVSQAASDMSNKVFDAITGVTGKFPLDPNGKAEMLLSMVGSAAGVATLIQNPSLLVNAFIGPIQGLRTFAQDPNSSFGILRSLFDYGSPSTQGSFSGTAGTQVQTIPAITPATTQQMANQAAMVNLVRRTALVEAARSTSSMTFTSYNDAMSTLNEISQRLDDEMTGTSVSIQPAPDGSTDIPDAVYVALRDLRVAVIRDITTRGADLSPLISYTPNATLPAVVIAHGLYGNADMAEDIVARNGIEHPGFVPGGMTLEVLANA